MRINYFDTWGKMSSAIFGNPLRDILMAVTGITPATILAPLPTSIVFNATPPNQEINEKMCKANVSFCDSLPK